MKQSQILRRCGKALLAFQIFLVGAPGLLAQSNPHNGDLIDSVSAERLREHVLTLQEAGGHNSRVTFTPGNDSAAAYIDRVMRSLDGLSSVELDTFYVPGQAPYNAKPVVNVIGTLEGVTQPEKVLLLGAHYDCSASRMGDATWNAQWYTIEAPGADDNATGVACILELARLLSDPATGFGREITLKFVAFGSEESGPAHDGSHNGSTHYASEARARGEDIVGMLSIDMIGYNWSHNYTSIVSDGNSAWLGDQFRSAIFNEGIPLETSVPPYPYATYSDHEAFWAQGYPAIMLVEHAPPWTTSAVYSANPYYHKSSDTLETVNFNLVRLVTQAVLAMSATMGGGVSEVEKSLAVVPLSLELLPAYPNPFNPRTTISYLLPHAMHVDVRVFDNLGRELAVLIQQRLEGGEHRISFDGSGLPSGVYLVRLQASGLTQVQKVVLMK